MNKSVITTLLTAAAMGLAAPAMADVSKARLLNARAVELTSGQGQTLLVDFYGDNIFRLFRDDTGGIVRNPEATPPATILASGARAAMGALKLEETSSVVNISTKRMELSFDKKTGALTVTDLANGNTPIKTIGEPELAAAATSLSLKAGDEYFYGGGVQNGRFSHRGEVIQIVNTNNWTDGGVASPTPFYWSTAGYGMMWHTFAPGKYDFGKAEAGTVTLTHETGYLDVFFMVDKEPVALLNDFYQLTGKPVLLPKFGFYEGHLNAYNRDFWKEDENGILFEDGKKYKESQTDNGGIKESLNGELPGNYQFSARAVVDRYEKADMPLGWVLPNDGYGAGYGQTSTLDGNIRNLKEFGDYARSKGVEIGLWTQNDLHPKEGIEALLQRDIVKEVRDAGVRVLKTDVAWVGAGYSFGLNGVADVGEVMPYYGNEARPFIISLDGWAGTQRYAGIWTGDQTGGEWEYIRFHIPTYIGSGLSGQPNICSDMDGIFGGRNLPVNVRDFQWKTFTPMQLNMDGWGSNPKFPQALGKEAADINRQYLKLKAAFMPYTYSIAREAVTGKPMVRAMFLEDCNSYTLGTATRYQFMYGPGILVAPIYKDTRMKENGDDERDGIYLPQGEWVAAGTLDVYNGGRIINNYSAPLQLLPYFYKRGAIIPMTEPHNNPSQVKADLRIYRIFPSQEKTSFLEYDDDGCTQAYLNNECTTTLISQQVTADKKGVARATIAIDPMEGSYEGMTTTRATVLEILASSTPKKITAKVGGKPVVAVVELSSEETLGAKSENRFMRITLPAKDVRQKIEVVIDGYTLNVSDPDAVGTGTLAVPQGKGVVTGPRTLTPQWEAPRNASYCEVEFEGRIYSTVKHGELLFEDLVPETEYSFRLRAVNADGKSEWSEKITAKTEADPLEHAVRGMRGEATVADQPGQGVKNLFDFDESKGWHTAWSAPNSTPFDLIIDMRTVNVLERMEYMPRPDAGNGTITKGTIAWSMDKQTWHDEQPFTWARDGKVKGAKFDSKPTARYIRLHVDEAVGGFGSGQELYVFRVPGSEFYIPGDVNHDNRIDENDLTSYMNYTGLRSGDPDYEGYMNQGDLDKNGLIDAYDISAVAIELESGVSSRKVEPVAGKVIVTQDKARYAVGDEMVISVSGRGLKSVNAISLCLPYNADELEYLGVDAVGTLEMRNLTYDRLHSNGQKALYPTFVNCGEHPYIEGDTEIMKIRFLVKKAAGKAPAAKDCMIVDKYLNRILM